MAATSRSIRFATAADGARIAYAQHGSGPPLVIARGWISHIELHWQDTTYRSFLEILGSAYTVYTYDCRGNGLSSRMVGDVTWDALVSDIHAVARHAGLGRFHLWGSTFGSIVAARYAAAYPDAVEKLILDGTFLNGRDIAGWSQRKVLALVLRRLPDLGFRLLADATNPLPNQASYRRPEISQQMIAPRMASRLYDLALRSRNERVFRNVTVPTLVLHRRNSRTLPVESGRAVAQTIPGADFRAVDGSANNLWEENGPESLRLVSTFLGQGIPMLRDLNAPLHFDTRRLAAILFADAVSYTMHAGRNAPDTQDATFLGLSMLRSLVHAYGGFAHGEFGDSLLGEFTSASGAVACALEFQKGWSAQMAEHGEKIAFRVGINLGEVEAARGSVFGDVVNITQRLQAAAQPGTVLVSETVFHSLYSQPTLRFEPVNATGLKNVQRDVRAYAVRDADDTDHSPMSAASNG